MYAFQRHLWFLVFYLLVSLAPLHASWCFGVAELAASARGNSQGPFLQGSKPSISFKFVRLLWLPNMNRINSVLHNWSCRC